MICIFCGNSLEMLSAKGKNRIIIFGQTHTIQEDIKVPTCPTCNEIFLNPKHNLELELSVRRTYNLLFDVLILDDTQERHDWFTQKLKFCNIKRAYNADEAKAHLDDYYFNYVFLDHDLGENNGDGLEVAEHLSNKQKPLFTFVHSHNIERAKLMSKILGKRYFSCHQVPFGKWLDSFIKEKFPFLINPDNLPER